MSKKTDLRIVRTQKSIREAFLKLLKEKRYEHITIQEIAEEAMINRNTFYLHYLDKDDLLEKLSQECLEELEQSLSEGDKLSSDGLDMIIKEVLGSIQKNISFYQAVMSDNGISCFSERFKEVIRNHISGGLKKSKPLEGRDEQQREVCIEYMVSGFVGVIYFWLNNSMRYSVEEIVEVLYNVHAQNIACFL